MKKFQFSFVCDQDPMNMQIVDGKRKCAACMHHLTDYTNMTAAQIASDLNENPTGCCFMFPWQEKEINDYFELHGRKPNRFSKFIKHAAVVSAPLLFAPTPSNANKRPAIEQISSHCPDKINTGIKNENNLSHTTETTHRFNFFFRNNNKTTTYAFSEISFGFYDKNNKLMGTFSGKTDSTGTLNVITPFMETADRIVIFGSHRFQAHLKKNNINKNGTTKVQLEEVKHPKHTAGMKKVSTND